MPIKPLYVKYDETKPEDMVVVSFETGMIIEGDKKTPSDTPTHLEWYRCFTNRWNPSYTLCKCCNLCSGWCGYFSTREQYMLIIFMKTSFVRENLYRRK